MAGVLAFAGPIIGGVIGAHGAESAASTQAGAADRASQVQMDMFNRTRADLQPYMDSGKLSLAQLQAFMGINPDGTTNPNAPGLRRFTQADLPNDPGYQFRMSEGENAIMNQRSAMGGVLSGATLKDLTRFAQGTASDEFNTAWQRNNVDLGNQWDRLFGLTTMGSNAAAGVGTMGMNTAASVGSNIIGAGNATAAGQVGVANSLTGGISGIYNNYIMGQILANAGMYPPGSSGGGPNMAQGVQIPGTI